MGGVERGQIIFASFAGIVVSTVLSAASENNVSKCIEERRHPKFSRTLRSRCCKIRILSLWNRRSSFSVSAKSVTQTPSETDGSFRKTDRKKSITPRMQVQLQSANISEKFLLRPTPFLVSAGSFENVATAMKYPALFASGSNAWLKGR